MPLPEDVRVYLSRRVAFLYADIDKCYSEVNLLNKLLRDAHSADIQTVPSFEAREAAFPPHPAVQPLAPRPKLSSAKSSPDIKAWPVSPTDQHPALRAAVDSQSRYPRFPRQRLIS